MKLDFIFHKVSSSLVQYNKKKEIGNLSASNIDPLTRSQSLNTKT